MYPVFRQKFGCQKNFLYFFIPVIPAALADVFHITPLKNTANDKACLLFVIDLLKTDIPEDPLVENGYILLFHTTNIRKSPVFYIFDETLIPKIRGTDHVGSG